MLISLLIIVPFISMIVLGYLITKAPEYNEVSAE